MIGAIAGDIIGSVYEHQPIKTKEFSLFHPACRFTDDSVLTLAVAWAILNEAPYAQALRAFGRRYPKAGYGARFARWLEADDAGPYNSWGNGAAMRAGPVGLAFDDEARVCHEAEKSARGTHDHPEGIKGAQAIALAVYLARTGHPRREIRDAIQAEFGYDLKRRLADLRAEYRFDPSCQGSVPPALIAFFESEGFEDAIRNAVALGGDSDTLACMTGSVAGAFYRSIPEDIQVYVASRLPPELHAILQAFCHGYPCGPGQA